MTNGKNGRNLANRLRRILRKMARFSDSPEEDKKIEAKINVAGADFLKALETQRRAWSAVRDLLLGECDKAERMGRSKRNIRKLRTAIERASVTFEIFDEDLGQKFGDEVAKACELWVKLKEKPPKI